MALYSRHGLVVGVLSRRKVADKSLDNVLVILVGCRNNSRNVHGVFGDSTCLVHAEHVNSCKSLDTFHVVNQYLAQCKAHCTDYKGNAGKEEESLRYHAYNSGNH